MSLRPALKACTTPNTSQLRSIEDIINALPNSIALLNDHEWLNYRFKRVAQFYLESTRSCWWCKDDTRPIMAALTHLFCYSTSDSWLASFKNKLALQLALCKDCAKAYQDEKPVRKQMYKQYFADDTVDQMFSIIDQWDVTRLVTRLTQSPIGDHGADIIIWNSVFESLYSDTLIVKHPKLLSAVISAINLAVASNCIHIITDSLIPGLVSLAFVSDNVARKYSRDLLKYIPAKVDLRTFESGGIRAHFESVLLNAIPPKMEVSSSTPCDIARTASDNAFPYCDVRFWRGIKSLISLLDDQVLGSLLSFFPRLPVYVCRAAANPDTSSYSDLVICLRLLLLRCDRVQFWDTVQRELQMVPADIATLVFHHPSIERLFVRLREKYASLHDEPQLSPKRMEYAQAYLVPIYDWIPAFVGSLRFPRDLLAVKHTLQSLLVEIPSHAASPLEANAVSYMVGARLMLDLFDRACSQDECNLAMYFSTDSIDEGLARIVAVVYPGSDGDDECRLLSGYEDLVSVVKELIAKLLNWMPNEVWKIYENIALLPSVQGGPGSSRFPEAPSSAGTPVLATTFINFDFIFMVRTWSALLESRTLDFDIIRRVLWIISYMFSWHEVFVVRSDELKQRYVEAGELERRFALIQDRLVPFLNYVNANLLRQDPDGGDAGKQLECELLAMLIRLSTSSCDIVRDKAVQILGGGAPSAVRLSSSSQYQAVAERLYMRHDTLFIKYLDMMLQEWVEFARSNLHLVLTSQWLANICQYAIHIIGPVTVDSQGSDVARFVNTSYSWLPSAMGMLLDMMGHIASDQADQIMMQIVLVAVNLLKYYPPSSLKQNPAYTTADYRNANSHLQRFLHSSAVFSAQRIGRISVQLILTLYNKTLEVTSADTVVVLEMGTVLRDLSTLEKLAAEANPPLPPSIVDWVKTTREAMLEKFPQLAGRNESYTSYLQQDGGVDKTSERANGPARDNIFVPAIDNNSATTAVASDYDGASIDRSAVGLDSDEDEFRFDTITDDILADVLGSLPDIDIQDSAHSTEGSSGDGAACDASLGPQQEPLHAKANGRAMGVEGSDMMDGGTSSSLEAVKEIKLQTGLAKSYKQFKISDWLKKSGSQPSLTSRYHNASNTISSSREQNVASTWSLGKQALKRPSLMSTHSGNGSLITSMRMEHLANIHDSRPPLGAKRVLPPKQQVSSTPRSLGLGEHPAKVSDIKVCEIPKPAPRAGGEGSSSESDSDSDSDSGGGLKALMEESMEISRRERQVESDRRTKMIELPGLVSTGVKRTFGEGTVAAAWIKDEELRQKRLEDPDFGPLYRTVLRWSYESSGELPTYYDKAQYRKVPKVFESVEEYDRTFEPLLILEVWMQFLRSKVDAYLTNTVHTKLTTRCNVDSFLDITLKLPMAEAKMYGDNDIITLIEYGSSTGSGSNANDKLGMAKRLADQIREDQLKNTGGIDFSKEADRRFKDRGTLLGKVQSKAQSGDDCEMVVRLCLDRGRSEKFTKKLTIGSTWESLRLFSLTPVQREYSALKRLRYLPKPMLRDILKPKVHPIKKFTEDEIRSCMKAHAVNQPQAEAILSATRREQGFTLIQGPPGTGKTKTILGLVGALLSRQLSYQAIHDRTQVYGSHEDEKLLLGGNEASSAHSRAEGKKILVCAPSNAAVDEIVKRLTQGIRDGRGKTFFPRVVRVGQPEVINTAVQKVGLDYLIDKELNTFPISGKDSKAVDSPSTGPGDFRKDDERIQAEIDKLYEQKAELNVKIGEARVQLKGDARKSLSETRELEATIRMYSRKISEIVAQIAEKKSLIQEQKAVMDKQRRKVKMNILQRTDVLCCTLSGSGHDLLASINYDFETVIIDEAAQSVELSSLIPLKYGCRRCVLVGDPDQLPPTVLSQVATKYKYEQSLFVRIQANSPDMVSLLSIQYRMHPDISRFPSRLFYDSRLTDGPNMATKQAAEWHRTQNNLFPPFCFFDIHMGREKAGRSGSYTNEAEVEAAAALVERLCTSFPHINFGHRLGVITPYKEQLKALKRRFKARFKDKILDVIDFNTIDGFQGQEKDIIIFSCVRAGGSGVGFLADTRRMNVGLTRARKSLFVLGNSKFLNTHPLWRQLIEDSARRGLHRVCTRPFFDISLQKPTMKLDNLMKVESEVADETVIDGEGNRREWVLDKIKNTDMTELKDEKLQSRAMLETKPKPAPTAESATESSPALALQTDKGRESPKPSVKPTNTETAKGDIQTSSTGGSSSRASRYRRSSHSPTPNSTDLDTESRKRSRRKADSDDERQGSKSSRTRHDSRESRRSEGARSKDRSGASNSEISSHKSERTAYSSKYRELRDNGEDSNVSSSDKTLRGDSSRKSYTKTASSSIALGTKRGSSLFISRQRKKARSPVRDRPHSPFRRKRHDPWAASKQKDSSKAAVNPFEDDKLNYSKKRLTVPCNCISNCPHNKDPEHSSSEKSSSEEGELSDDDKNDNKSRDFSTSAFDSLFD
ncbi:DEAD-box type RNA helicase [Spiromyces aspiralis]|uniref:DEAD-box type RNA helicase n=1 Tax=Spiromyces aspiralis TaxID=68401 RepID=A0ACC1HIG0_9FUNG|nr:DEAD-box type RNA helicase [Spiromyces aspiralis]